MTCSWFLKILLLAIFTLSVAIISSSSPQWFPINPHKGCAENLDDDSTWGVGKYMLDFSTKHDAVGYVDGEQTLGSCQNLCMAIPRCQALDFYKKRGRCIFFSKPCLRPTADVDGASSYQLLQNCQAKNGTAGIVIGGKCDTQIQIPSYGFLFLQEAGELLTSPVSWLFTFAVVFLYTWIMSAWFRSQLKPVASQVGWRCRKIYDHAYFPSFWRFFKLLLLVTWAWLTFNLWEDPKTTSQLLPLPEVVSEGSGELPFWLWSGLSAFVILLINCPCVRSVLITVVGSIAAFLMSLITGLTTTSLGLCFDFLGMGVASTFGGGAAMLETAAAADAVAAADAAVGAEALLAADGAAAGTSTAESASATEAAVAAEAAAVAQAGLEGAGAAALCTVM
jgi:hypothetical protein